VVAAGEVMFIAFNKRAKNAVKTFDYLMSDLPGEDPTAYARVAHSYYMYHCLYGHTFRSNNNFYKSPKAVREEFIHKLLKIADDLSATKVHAPEIVGQGILTTWLIVASEGFAKKADEMNNRTDQLHKDGFRLADVAATYRPDFPKP